MSATVRAQMIQSSALSIEKVLIPTAAVTPLLAIILSVVLLAPAIAFSQNDGPPAVTPATGPVMLDLSGTLIPDGANGTYQLYTVAFTAGLANTTITFAFRDDPANISFTNASVTDLTNPSGNLLLNGSFTSGTGSAPTGWTYAGTANGGAVASSSNSCYAYGTCWYDGTLQAYDTLSQAIATNVGDTYQISFYVAEDSHCSTNGGGSTCKFSQLSTNGDTTDDGGNGIDVVVFAQGGTLATQQLSVTLLDPGNGQVTDNTGALICSEAGGVVQQTINGTPTVQTNATCTASYPYGTVVSLTAAANEPSSSTPASTFAGWGAACAGSKGDECTLTMNSSQTATAGFAIPGQIVTLPVAPGQSQTYGFNQGTGQTPYDFTVLNNGSTTFGVTVNPITISQANCNTLINPSFPGANCLVYQLGTTPSIPPDTAVVFEVTCPSSPGGTCGSTQQMNFLATLGTDFSFSVPPVGPQENAPLFLAGYPNNAPVYGPLQAQGLADPNPYIGFLKGSGPDPLHPCTPFTPADNPANASMFSNQAVSFVLGDTSGSSKSKSGGTGSCWALTYLTPGEIPTVTIAAPVNNGDYQQGQTDATTLANYTCTAVNAGDSQTGPYLSVASCSATDTPGGSVSSGAQFDTTTPGPHTFTATVLDSATNIASSTVTYYVQGSTTTTVTSSPNPSTFGQTITFTATVTGVGATPTGTIAWSANTGCASSVLVSGRASCQVSSFAASSTPYVVTATFSGDNSLTGSNSNAGSMGMDNQTVSAATPTAKLSVTNSPVTYTGAPQAAAVAIGSSSVPGTVSNILYNGSPTAPTAAGTYAVTANFVPNDSTDYSTLSAVAAGNFVISQATPTATLSVSNPQVTYIGSPQAATVVISSSSVLGTVANILYNGSPTPPTVVGTYTVTANFVPSDGTDYSTLTGISAGSFVIKSGTPTATLAVTNSPVTYTGSPQGAMVGIVSSSVAGTVANILYNGSPAAPTAAGSYTVTASFIPTDGTDYNTLNGLAAGSFLIKQASQTITFTMTAPASAANGSKFTVAAGASSGLAVVFSASGSCTNSGATYTMTSSTGTCSVIANQSGNTNYLAAPTNAETVNATPPPAWSVSPAPYAFPTLSIGQSASQVFTVTNPPGGATTAIVVSIPGSGNENSPTDADDFAITSNGCRGVSLAGGKSCSVTVTFTPDNDNLGLPNGASANLQVANANTKAVLAYSTMTGVTIDPTGTLTVDSNSFTSTGTITQMVATVTNPSSSVTPLILANSYITRGNSYFRVAGGANNCNGATLAPGASCAVYVTFTPPSGGSTVSGTIVIPGNSTNQLSVALSGKR